MIKEIEALQEAIKGEKRIAKNFYKIAASFPEDCNEISDIEGKLYCSSLGWHMEQEKARYKEMAEHHEQIAKWLEALLDRRTVKLEEYHIERLEALTDTKIEDNSDLSYALQVVIDESYFDEFPEDCNKIENDDVVAVDERGEFDFGCPKCNWTSRVFSKAMIPLCPKCHIEMWPIPGKYY